MHRVLESMKGTIEEMTLENKGQVDLLEELVFLKEELNRSSQSLLEVILLFFVLSTPNRRHQKEALLAHFKQLHKDNTEQLQVITNAIIENSNTMKEQLQHT